MRDRRRLGRPTVGCDGARYFRVGGSWRGPETPDAAVAGGRRDAAPAGPAADLQCPRALLSSPGVQEGGAAECLAAVLLRMRGSDRYLAPVPAPE